MALRSTTLRPLSRGMSRGADIKNKNRVKPCSTVPGTVMKCKGISGIPKSQQKFSSVNRVIDINGGRHCLPENINIRKQHTGRSNNTLFVQRNSNECTTLNSERYFSTKGQESFLQPSSVIDIDKKFINCRGDAGELVGLVLGVLTRSDDPYGSTKIFTKYAEEYDKMVGNKLSEVLDSTGPIPKKGQCKVLYKVDPQFSAVAIAGIGDECASYSETEQIDEMKENVRDAAALGVRTLQELNMKTILIEGMGSTEAAAEGSALGVWRFQELKSSKNQMLIPRIELHGNCDFTAWQIGLQKAAAQNIARQLCETPANILTPIGFAQAAVEILCKAGVSVEVKVRDWSKIMKMGGYLAASKGSCEPPIFLELSYYGCEPDIAPVVLIGKAVTFDSGGICLKSGGFDEMKNMRGDMAGSACLIGAVRAAAALQLPINIRGLMPIYENLPGTCAMKPGDIITTKSGKTVLINDTDYDGRLSLADALTYSQIFNPKLVLDVGTLSKELLDSLGYAASGVYSNNDSLFEMLKNAAVHTGDRIWRLPLWKHFSQKVNNNQTSDIQDHDIKSGMPCSCAAFLKEFVPPSDWVHLDIYNVTWSDGNSELYLRKGMSGRPTRTIVEFLAQLACRIDDEGKEGK